MATVVHFEHFGHPHGRFLERVSVAAGAVAVAVPGGGLRAVDVGKRIAIPGAADLHAQITRLVRRTDVTGRMDAGGSTLLATFPDPDDRFQRRVHEGLRITVAGAGPGGSTLVTDVRTVHEDGVRLELDAVAAAAVEGAETILNDPGRVLLNDHARRGVDGLTVDLGDRVVDDVAMILGHVAMTSATARFSSLDLDKPVVLRAAGRHVSTIALVQDETTATLAEPAQRSVTDVPADVWLVAPADEADARVSFEKLLAHLAVANVESAEIRFASGVYDFTPATGAGARGGISIRGLADLTLVGAGPGATILRLRPDQDLPGDAHVVHLRSSRRIGLRDLSVHGAYLTMGRVNEQMHGVFVAEGCAEIAVERVRVYQVAGDGIRLLGSPAEPVRRVWVEGCRLIQNKRTGIAFQRDVQQVWVRDCVIEMTPPSNDACIDFEPTGQPPASAPRDIVIDSNMLLHGTATGAVALSGIDDARRLRNVRFVDNLVVGGSIFVTDVDGLLMRGNVVAVPSGAPPRISLNVAHGGRDVTVVANLFVNENPQVEAVLQLGRGEGRGVERALVADNLCRTVSGSGILVISAADTAVSRNTVAAAGLCAAGVFAKVENAPLRGMAIRDNIITVDGGGWETGVRVNGGAPGVEGLSIVGNTVRGANQGIAFKGQGFLDTPVCALNQTRADVATPLVGLEQLRAVVVGGAVTGPVSGAGRQLTGMGDPNGTVSGSVGDMYVRVDGGPDETFYVKESADVPNEGWTAK
jgi:hypothetical protein